jgi:AcrR family transcriptional regulator
MSSLTDVSSVERVEDGRVRRAARKRQRRREQILAAAQQVFATRGYHAAAVSDMIELAGISRGTFYLYFDGKQAIFRELLDGFVQQLMDAVEVVDPSSPDTTPMLYANIRRVVELLFDNPNLTKVLLRAASGLDPEVDKALSRLDEFLLDMVMGALVNGAAWGITRKVDERIVATAIIGSIKEVLHQSLVVDGSEQIDRDNIAHSLLDYALRGLLPTRV